MKILITYCLYVLRGRPKKNHSMSYTTLKGVKSNGSGVFACVFNTVCCRIVMYLILVYRYLFCALLLLYSASNGPGKVGFEVFE